MERTSQILIDAGQPLSHFAPNSRVPVDEVYFPQVNWPEPIGPRARFPRVRTAWNEPTHFWRQDERERTCGPLAYANACEVIGADVDGPFFQCMLAYARASEDKGVEIDTFFSAASMYEDRTDAEISKLRLTQEDPTSISEATERLGNGLLHHFSTKKKAAMIANIDTGRIVQGRPVSINVNRTSHAVCIAGVRTDQSGHMDMLIIDSQRGIGTMPIELFVTIYLQRVPLFLLEKTSSSSKVRGHQGWPLVDRNAFAIDFFGKMEAIGDPEVAKKARGAVLAYQTASDPLIIDGEYTIK